MDGTTNTSDDGREACTYCGHNALHHWRSGCLDGADGPEGKCGCMSPVTHLLDVSQ